MGRPPLVRTAARSRRGLVAQKVMNGLERRLTITVRSASRTLVIVLQPFGHRMDDLVHAQTHLPRQWVVHFTSEGAHHHLAGITASATGQPKGLANAGPLQCRLIRKPVVFFGKGRST